MKKWSKIVGQIILVAAYWFQFSHGNPPDAFNPNKATTQSIPSTTFLGFV